MTPYRERRERGDFEPGKAAESSYDQLSKAELIEEAQRQGISPANATMSKAELVEALERG
jgi:hypothetical protein